MADIVERLRLWNPWWEGEKSEWTESYIHRNIEDKLLKFSKDPIVKMVVGPRRAGKTTLMHYMAFELSKKTSVVYINLEDIFLRRYKLERLVGEYIRWSGDDNPIIFIDEVQRTKSWDSQLRTLIDREGFSIYASGSTAKLLKGRAASSLGGRAVEFSLYPLSVGEIAAKGRTPFTSKQKWEGLLDNVLEYGLFPAVFSQKEEDKKLMLLSSYVDTLVTRDVGAEIEESPSLIMDVFKYIVDGIGSPLSINAIRKAMHISYERAEKIFEGMINAYAVVDIPFFSSSTKVQRHMHRKAYPIDNGYISVFQPKRDRGKKLENFVALELLKRDYRLYYYKGRRECDLIAVKGNRTIPIQVTWKNVSGREAEGLIEAEKIAKSKGEMVTRENLLEFLKRL